MLITLLMMMVVLMLLLMKRSMTKKLRHDSRLTETSEDSNQKVDVETLEIQTRRRTVVKGGGMKVEGGK